MRTRLLGTVAVAAFFSVVCLGMSDDKPAATTDQKDDAKTSAVKAPEFTLHDLDGKTHALKDLKDKIIVLEWTNKDCPTWKGKMTLLTETATKYTGKGVVWFHVDSTHNMKEADNREFMKKYKITVPVLVDRDGKVGRAFKAKTTPHMFIIDKTGNIAYDGDIDNGEKGDKVVNYVSKALDELLAGKPVTTAKTNPHGCTVKYAPASDKAPEKKEPADRKDH